MNGENSDGAIVARPLRKFNPGLLQSDDEVIRQFVVRQHEFKLVREVLMNNIGTPSCQHILVVAPRGHGKSMLLARMAAEIRQDEELGRNLLPVRFMEESQEIDGLADFWLETLFNLGGELSSYNAPFASELLRTHADLSNRWREQGLAELAQAAVLDAADRLDRRLVLMVENMQSLLANVDDEFGWKLRNVMQTSPQIILLASATSHFEELVDPSAPFFELFHVVYLEALKADSCLRLWTEITGQSPLSLEVRPLQILTGGNPRLLVMVAAFARHRSLRQLMEEIVSLIDENTDYFRGNLESLPKHERRVFVSLIDLWQASNTGEIAARARLDVRVVSTMLGRLVERGAVTVVSDSKGGKRLYAAAERLYSIYYKLRRERDEASVVEALIQFMVAFYEAKDVHRFSERLVQDALASKGIQDGIDRALAGKFLSQDVDMNTKWDELQRMSDLIKNSRFRNAATRFQKDVRNAYENKDWKCLLEIVDRYEAIPLPDFLSKWEGEHVRAHLAVLKSDAYLCLKEYHKVIEVSSQMAERLRDTQDAIVLSRANSMGFNSARAYYHLEDFERSIKECDLLLEHYDKSESPWYDLQVAEALILKARSVIELGNIEHATDLLDEVHERFGRCNVTDVQRVVAGSMVVKGEVAQIQCDEHLRATEIYGEVLHRFKESDDSVIRIHVKSAWMNMGFAHGMVGNFNNEIECYEELVAWLDKRNAAHEKTSALTALIYKGRRLAELGRAEEALAASKDSAKRLDSCGNNFEPEIRQWIDWYMGGTEALALMATGASDIAMDSFSSAYSLFDPGDALHVGEMLRLVPEMIAAGAAEDELVDVLQSDTIRAQRLLPMIVALQQRMGESVRAPAEVREVAEDFEGLVNKRIVEGLMPGYGFRMA